MRPAAGTGSRGGRGERRGRGWLNLSAGRGIGLGQGRAGSTPGRWAGKLGPPSRSELEMPAILGPSRSLLAGIAGSQPPTHCCWCASR